MTTATEAQPTYDPGPVMPVVRRWKVQSGDMDEIVEAESRDEAVAKLFTMFDDCECELDELPEPGLYVSTVEVIGDELWEDTKDAMRRAGRLAGSTDASTAARQLIETRQNHGSKVTATRQGDSST